MKILLGVLVSIFGFWIAQGAITPPIPVPSRSPGFFLGYGHPGSKIQLEAFVELNCPDSQKAWAVLKELAGHYSGDDLGITIHHLPLPYHRNGFISTQGFYYVEDVSPDRSVDYMNAICHNLSYFSSSNTRDKNEIQIIRSLGNFQEPLTGIPVDVFEAGIDNPVYRTRAINNWKYGVSRGVSGTPWYFVNGVDLSLDPDVPVDFATWTQFLDGLLGDSSGTNRPQHQAGTDGEATLAGGGLSGLLGGGTGGSSGGTGTGTGTGGSLSSLLGGGGAGSVGGNTGGSLSDLLGGGGGAGNVGGNTGGSLSNLLGGGGGGTGGVGGNTGGVGGSTGGGITHLLLGGDGLTDNLAKMKEMTPALKNTLGQRIATDLTGKIQTGSNTIHSTLDQITDDLTNSILNRIG